MVLFNPNDIGIGIFMLALLFATFVAMTRYGASQALALPLVACAMLALQRVLRINAQVIGGERPDPKIATSCSCCGKG
jgi:hypothetical protein